jgi:uncharacterized membrane protein
MNEIKTLGILGSIFTLLSFLPQAGIIFFIIGIIFLLIAIYKFSKLYDDEKIFEKFILGTVVLFVATVLFYFKIAAIIMSLILGVFSANPIIPFTFTVLAYFAIYYFLNIYAMMCYSKTFETIYLKEKNSFFKYAGTLLVWGAVLNVLGIGFILQEIGWLLLLLGFLTLEKIYEGEIIEERELEKKD